MGVSTGKVANEKSMMVWRPHGNKMFETFSFLPPLSDADLTKQVQYLLNNGWTPCLRQRQLLRQQILGHVEVADVRLQQRRRSHPRSQGGRQGVPELLCQMRRLRQHQASAMCWLLVLQTEVGPDGRLPDK